MAYRGSEVRRLAGLLEKSAADRDIISFGGGAPSLAPPEEVMRHVAEKFIKEPRKTMTYTSTEGLPEARKFISDDLKKYDKIDIEPNCISITAGGGTAALFETLVCAINPGDEVIISDPTYLGYREPIKLLGGKPVSVDTCWQGDFQMKPEDLAEKVNKKTKAILMLNPSNPTGSVMKKENIKGIAEIAEDKKLWLITDDVYRMITYERPFYNARLFCNYENVVTCNSFSKEMSAPALRTGYVYGPKEFMAKFDLIQQAVSLTPSRVGQIAVEKFLENNGKIKEEYLSKTVIPTYKKRRDAMAKAFEKHLPELEFAKPQGAFYFFVDFGKILKEKKMDEHQFSQKLFEEKSVAIIAGHPFGDRGRGHFRFTFVSEDEKRIDEGMKRIADFIKK
ncbi:MAG: pyridoxal phosphate-dependent aminotransferase [Candidatus Micrarchaeota archaeon]